jgi:isoaspartyl peptidase/L-asparaginase-like protein (Ntn-hydrolase superfamily)
MSDFVLAIHGGAGPYARAHTSAAVQREVREALRATLADGRDLLAGGASALDAVEQAVMRLEDHPAFNAGTGAALTSAGSVELDAAVMEGATRALGAVACVRTVKNPVALARRVLARGVHVLLVGEGAEAFARDEGFAEIDPESLVTPLRRAEWERARAAVRTQPASVVEARGTVGAVARDARGHLAAATSTGGMQGQLPGRVGDSPLAGAGTWADDLSCAVSATGHGEAFIRCAFAHEVDARVRLAGASLEAACQAALDLVQRLRSNGGCVAVGPHGEPVLAFNTIGMYRGWVGARSAPSVALFADE